MNADFFTRLYKGFRAEYVVMGELYGLGLEAFKLPGDFGFDLIATNLKEATDGETNRQRAIEPPYSLQIKSTAVASIEGNGGYRTSADVQFYLKQSEIDLIIDSENAFFVFVIFIPNTDRLLNERHFCFWLHGSHVKKMLAQGYFEPCVIGNHERLRLSAVIRFKPSRVLADLLNEMPEGTITADGKKFLVETLPERVPLNWKAGEYVSLRRPSKTKPQEMVDSIVPTGMTSLRNLGVSIDMKL